MKEQSPFKQKLYNYTLPVRDDVWDRIDAQLPPQKRKFPLFWLALGGTVLIGALITGLALTNAYQDKNETPDTRITHGFTANTHPISKNENAITPATSENLTPDSSTKETASAHSSLKNPHQTLTHQTPLLSTSENSPTLLTDNINGVSEVSQHDFRRSFIEVADLSDSEIYFIDQEEEYVDMSSIKPDPSCYKFSGSNGKHALSVDIFAGPGFAPRTFEDTGGESPLYADAREATESSQYAWAAGARVNLELQHGLALRLGLMYEQIGDIFDYTDTSATQQTTRIDSFFDANGNFLYTETSTETIFGTLIKKIHNRYSRIDIPLLASYELPMGRSLVMLNAGPVLNLTSTQKGQILDPSLVPKHITPGEPDELKAYKTNLGVSVYLGVGLLFPLSDNISGLIEPRLLYRINPVTLDSYSLKEHRSFAGLNLGIRYHFN